MKVALYALVLAGGMAGGLASAVAGPKVCYVIARNEVREHATELKRRVTEGIVPALRVEWEEDSDELRVTGFGPRPHGGPAPWGGVSKARLSIVMRDKGGFVEEPYRKGELVYWMLSETFAKASHYDWRGEPCVYEVDDLAKLEEDVRGYFATERAYAQARARQRQAVSRAAIYRKTADHRKAVRMLDNVELALDLVYLRAPVTFLECAGEVIPRSYDTIVDGCAIARAKHRVTFDEWAKRVKEAYPILRASRDSFPSTSLE